jgi:hypothetical protein
MKYLKIITPQQILTDGNESNPKVFSKESQNFANVL